MPSYLLIMKGSNKEAERPGRKERQRSCLLGWSFFGRFTGTFDAQFRLYHRGTSVCRQTSQTLASHHDDEEAFRDKVSLLSKNH